MTLRFTDICARSLCALSPWALVAVTAVSPAVAQDVKAQKERATGRITEMFCLRLDLQLDDLAQAMGEPTGVFDDAKAQGREAVTKWLEEHPVELQHTGPISWTATPIQYEPFKDFEESELWQTARAAALTTPQIELLHERNAERTRRAVAALSGLIQLRISTSLCLSEAEEESLTVTCEEAGAKVWEKGVIEAFDPYYRNETPKDTIREAVDEKMLIAALSPHRQTVLAEMLEKGRSKCHAYQLEAEFHLYGRDDLDQHRKLLYGLADALVHRDGGQEKRSKSVFVPTMKPSHDDDWLSALQSILDLDYPAKDVPSRAKKAHVDLRTEFLLAVLDERACFTEDQRESLLPLMKEFVETESLRSRSVSAPELVFPTVLGLSKDGLLIPGENDRFNRPSTKVRSLIKTFYEACTPAQQDVLKS